MDITPLFKACIKTIRMRNKALGVNDTSQIKSQATAPILRTKSEFNKRAREILSSVTRLRDFLTENRQAYLNNVADIQLGFLDSPGQMNDVERDQIDAGAQRIMKTCHQLIRDLRQEIVNVDQDRTQLTEHRDAVMDLMGEYLKDVCKVYSEQRAIRIKRSVDRQKMSRLSTDKQLYVPSNVTEIKRPPSQLEESQADCTEDFTSEELQMYENENTFLYNQLRSVADEVQQIEGQVVEIAQLQEIFTEKVMQQEKDIEHISATVVSATENVKIGNEQVRQAIQHNAGFRFWILFFLLVLSFSLLFLDWYND